MSTPSAPRSRSVPRNAQLHTNAAHDAQRACHVRPAAPDAPGASEKEFKARDAWRMRA